MCGTVTVSTIAGDGTPGFSDTAPVQFFHPCGVAVDSAGNVYVGDKFNQRIRKITPGPGGTVTVSTLAGSGTAGFSNTAPVQFYYPLGVAVDSAGNVYVADSANDRIRKITPGGTVTTLAGDGTPGFSNTEPIRFNNPTGVAVDSAGNVYVADKFNHRIRKITPGGTVSTIAGSGTAGPGAGQLNNPGGVAVDSARNVYVADSGNHRIRKITPGGTVSTIAGSGTAGFSDIGWGQFNEPLDVAVDSAGNVYVADLGNNRIRKITPSGTVSTLNTAFNSPSGVAVDSAGDVYVADNANHRIRKFTPSLSDTQITARTSCPTANYVSNFSQGSWDSLGSTGTCTQCGVPVNPTDYVTQICGLTSNTVISSASCAGATFASNFTRGSWDQLGQYQCLACPANSSSSSNELMCTCDPGYYSAYATCIQDKLSWAPTNSWVFGKGNSSADGSLKVKNVYFFQTELSRPSVIRLYDSLTTGVTSCTFCPAHTYGNQLGSTTCSPCPVGTQFLGTGGQISTVCTSCTVSSTCGTCPSATPKWNGTTCVS
jgi:sugar lactone lactonase YvrE